MGKDVGKRREKRSKRWVKGEMSRERVERVSEE